jgi:two-component system chemotaxis response regulator CheB
MAVGLKKILLLDCDAPNRKALTDFFAREAASFELLPIDSVNSALEILAREEIFLLVIFVADAGAFPQKFIKKIIAAYPGLEIVLVLPPDNQRIRNALPGHAGLHVIEKPFEPTALGHLIKELSSHEQSRGFTGTLKIVRLDDLIQMCCLSGATITIQVGNDCEKGQIFIREGDIIHARCGEKSGEEAFYTIMTWDAGGFETLDGIPDETVTIEANYQYLLLEAARRSDESSRGDEEEPPEESDLGTVEGNRLRVLMVEDSTIMAKIMSTMLQVSGDIEIAGIARNGQEALAMMEVLNYDVVLLDVNMPVMNGRVTIKHIMIKSPCPVVIMSNVGSRAPETVLSLLDLGAVDFISKPVRGGDFSLQQRKIVERVRQAARAKVSCFKRFHRPKKPRPAPENPENRPAAERLVVISSGCSGQSGLYPLLTGITETNRSAFVCLNSIPVTFLKAMTQHLKKQCQRTMLPLGDGTLLQGDSFYLDTLRRSLLLQPGLDGVQVRSLQNQHNSEYGPRFFDLFLFSAADVFQERLLVILLPGAATGNLEGLNYVRENGGRIFAQDPATSIMPDYLQPVSEAGLVDESWATDVIARRMVDWARSS